ncbi:hypothetical protein B0O80DRAFT_500967 [Mortierella sp. GBAus27b]|nr:hypothetical protein B0O80DRAFT_500967 [Mortierella sp. GBAus27b]
MESKTLHYPPSSQLRIVTGQQHITFSSSEIIPPYPSTSKISHGALLNTPAKPRPENWSASVLGYHGINTLRRPIIEYAAALLEHPTKVTHSLNQRIYRYPGSQFDNLSFETTDNSWRKQEQACQGIEMAGLQQQVPSLQRTREGRAFRTTWRW